MSFMKKFAIVLLFAVCFAAPSEAARYFVTYNGAGVKDASSWANASDNLARILNETKAGDEVWVAASTGRYYPNPMGHKSTPSNGHTFNVKANVKFYGGFSGTETELSQRNLTPTNYTELNGNGVTTVVTVGKDADSTFTIIDGFVIAQGKYTSWYAHGSGITNNSASPTIRNCTFKNNDDYGVIRNFASSPLIEDCIFENNGGAIRNEPGSYPIIKNCLFDSNWGPAVWNSSSSGRIENCSFIDNGRNNWWVLWAIENYSSNPVIVNSTFSSKNQGSDGEGGIYNNASNPIILNCTISENKGGGIRNENSTPIIVNTIVWGNGYEISNSNSTPLVTYSIVKGGHSGEGNVNSDPNLAARVKVGNNVY